MIVLNTSIISKTNGLYAQQAQENLKELKDIMKHLVLKEVNHDDTVWAGQKPSAMKIMSETTSTSTQTGGNIWSQTGVYRRNYVATGKKKEKVKTFAL